MKILCFSLFLAFASLLVPCSARLQIQRSTVLCLGLALMASKAVMALELPRPGEVEKQKAEGKLEDSVNFAKELGNHRIGPYLLQNLKDRIGWEGPIVKRHRLLPPGGSGMPASGNVRTFMLLIEFQDETHTVQSTTIDSMLYGAGDSANSPKESLTSWYSRSSYGLLDLSAGNTLAWYQTAYNRSSVTEDSAGRDALIKEVLEHFHDQGHDFSQYDNDGNGVVDYFMVMWTGPIGDWGSFWWGYQPSFSDASFQLDGVSFGLYSWQWEANNPTVVIHETGHALGLPDYYDYNGTVGPDGGVGGFDMMDGNSWDHNCFSKWMLDWLTPTVVDAGRQDLTLQHTSEHQEAVLIWPGVGTGDIFSEYFMVQNRQDVGNDDDGWFNVDGLVIWHIDATLNAAGTGFAYDNSFTDHKLLRLMEADGLEEIEAKTGADADDVYTEGQVFSKNTFPSSEDYAGSDTCVTVCSIIDLGIDSPISAAFNTECSQPPTCVADGPYFAECSGVETTLTLDGTGSSDPEPDDTLTFSWSTDCPGGGFDDSTGSAPMLSLKTLPGCLVQCNVFLSITDCANNIDSCSTSVTVTDHTIPDIQPPPDITVECDESTDPSNTGLATGTDACDPMPVVSHEDTITEGECPQERTIEREWTATDNCDNSNSDTQMINVVDTTAPMISCNVNDISPDDVNMNSPVVFQSTADDNCDDTVQDSVQFTGYDCYKINPNGRRIKSNCKITLAGDLVSIYISGGVGTFIDLFVTAEDRCGNVEKITCSLNVVRPPGN